MPQVTCFSVYIHHMLNLCGGTGCCHSQSSLPLQPVQMSLNKLRLVALDNLLQQGVYLACA